MNDLSGLDWYSKPGTGQKPAQPGAGNYSAFSTLQVKPTPPTSGRTSPLASNVPPQPPSKTSTPANDSFASLVGFSGSNSNKNLSLAEQQKLREQSKFQQLVGNKQQLQAQWAVNDDVWNTLGSGRSTPAAQNGNGTPAPIHSPAHDEDDLFAAFNQPAAVQGRPAPKSTPSPALVQQPDADDDDPFELSKFQARKGMPSQQPESLMTDEDDILGDLGRPVSARPPPKKEPPRRRPSPEVESTSTSGHPQDKAVAELVDMGFPADKAKRALEATDTGMNVQQAVGLLLNQAHEEAKQKARGREMSQSQDISEAQPARRQRPRPSAGEVERTETSQKDRSSTPSNDPTKAAQDLSSAFLKSAGSFWKQAQKQVQQVVSDFNSDTESGSSTPKWMQEAAAPKQRPRPDEQERRQAQAKVKQQEASVTDEALMLESQRPTPPPRQIPRSRVDPRLDSSADTSRDHSPAFPSRLRESSSPQPVWHVPRQQDPLASMMRPKPQQAPRSARDILSKQAAEEQASQAYTSSARRRKPTAPSPAPTQFEDDLLESASRLPAQNIPSRPATKSAPPQRPAKPATPIATRPPPPTRNIPPISAIALRASHTARVQGNIHFKRGDYSAAHESYSTSLRHIPAQHPLQLVLLTNRALTALKTGQPKLAVQDADAAIALIGTSKGESETIDIQDDDGMKTSSKPMRDYYGKALTRKAEALEHLEKWSEAASVYRQCVSDGHGGTNAIQGRARAEKAATPKPAAIKRPPPRAATRSAPVISAKPAAAVSALRAQNQAAEKLDDERFALADVVAARINGWKGGKEGNIRALLASLDTVLWEGAGWKKIGMADLVLPGKVKINYMKGIGKCHPDKVSNVDGLHGCTSLVS